MTRSRYLRVIVFASPGVALAVLGATHPAQLTYTSSAHWTVMHVIGLFVFPLVGAAQSEEPCRWVVHPPERVVVDDRTGDPAVESQHPGLGFDLLCREDPSDRA